MPTITLCLGQTGKLEGVTENDKTAYSKFLARVRTLNGSCIKFSWSEPRSGAFHRRHFALIHSLFDAKDKFVNQDQFRKWLEVGAGFAEFVPGKDGVIVAIPKSIAYDKLDQTEFEAIQKLIFNFAQSEYVRSYLWPHLSDWGSWSMVENLLFVDC